jgi:hypothetical protein
VQTVFFGGKPEGQRPLGRPRSRWENNIKMYLQEVGCGGMDWICSVYVSSNIVPRYLVKGVLSRIFGPKRDELTGEWRKVYNEELNDLYCSQNIVRVIKSRMNEMGRACSAHEVEERRIQGFGGET